MSEQRPAKDLPFWLKVWISALALVLSTSIVALVVTFLVVATIRLARSV
jgi:hypothetical protein